MMPRPVRPIEEAGPLNGKTLPILISVAVTPGASAAQTGVEIEVTVPADAAEAVN